MKNIIKISVFILLLLLVNYAIPANAAKTYHFGAAEKQLSSATTAVDDGYYYHTSLRTVCPSLDAGNIKTGVNIFGVTGTYVGTVGTNYNIPKTTQTTVYHAASGTDLGDDASVSSGWPGKGQAETSRWTTVESTKTPGKWIMVKDNATGLIWQRRGDMPLATNEAESGAPLSSTCTWDAAFAYVKSLNDSSYGGYTDWRLPNMKELISITNYAISYQTALPSCYETTNSTGQFTGTKCAGSDYYWSSTTFSSQSYRNCFFDGNTSNGARTVLSYVRAVRNYGSELAPTLTTTVVTNITTNAASSGGNISSDGGALVTSRGVCWNTGGSPTTADSKTTDGTGKGIFTSSITGLTPGTTYYVRAYAINSKGTAYGDQASFTASHGIGENYGGGIIFYVDGTGQHGLVAAPSDQSTGIAWDNGTNILTGANGTAVGTGQSNTTVIVTAQGAGSYAAKLCDDLVLNTYSDWFLPSKDELGLLWQQRVVVGGFNSTRYYSSSTEYQIYSAWGQHFSNNYQEELGKAGTNCVRAARAF